MNLSESLRRRILRWKSDIMDIVHRNTSAENVEEDSRSIQTLTEGTSNRTSHSISDYTELHGGCVPCPSCKGSGLIPKELESTLVALIPINDERLKPKRTWLIVTFWVSLCVIIGSLLIFLLMPRTVTMSSNRMPIEKVHVTDRDVNTSNYIDFAFLNKINVTSGNYMPVDLVNVTATITSKFQPWSTDIVGRGYNSTFTDLSPMVLYRTTCELVFNNTVHLKDVVAQYCQADFSKYIPLYVTLQFDISATLKYYYGHTEQVSLSIQQQVCCIPSGNCTSNN